MSGLISLYILYLFYKILYLIIKLIIILLYMSHFEFQKKKKCLFILKKYFNNSRMIPF